MMQRVREWLLKEDRLVGECKIAERISNSSMDRQPPQLTALMLEHGDMHAVWAKARSWEKVEALRVKNQRVCDQNFYIAADRIIKDVIDSEKAR